MLSMDNIIQEVKNALLYQCFGRFLCVLLHLQDPAHFEIDPTNAYDSNSMLHHMTSANILQ
jgi:hypothetical protein